MESTGNSWSKYLELEGGWTATSKNLMEYWGEIKCIISNALVYQDNISSIFKAKE